MRCWEIGGVAVAVIFSACAGWDNPTALDELNPDIEFEIETVLVETYNEVEIHVHAREGGVPMEMRQAQLSIEHHDGGETRVIELVQEGDVFAAPVRFFEPGEHHVHFSGLLERHQLMHEFGETEVEVHRLHQAIGPYWVEIAMEPGQGMRASPRPWPLTPRSFSSTPLAHDDLIAPQVHGIGRQR